jgi:hypothetical protein
MTTMLGRLLESAARRSAARKYARCLGPRLRLDYGGSEHYTVGQIRAGAGKCQLDMDHIAIGYAAFMPKTAFQDVAPDEDYQLLRDLFDRYQSTKATSAPNPASENLYAGSGGNFSTWDSN